LHLAVFELHSLQDLHDFQLVLREGVAHENNTVLNANLLDWLVPFAFLFVAALESLSVADADFTLDLADVLQKVAQLCVYCSAAD
jgi:hypothetical protein